MLKATPSTILYCIADEHPIKSQNYSTDQDFIPFTFLLYIYSHIENIAFWMSSPIASDVVNGPKIVYTNSHATTENWNKSLTKCSAANMHVAIMPHDPSCSVKIMNKKKALSKRSIFHFILLKWIDNKIITFNLLFGQCNDMQMNKDEWLNYPNAFSSIPMHFE